MRLVYGIVVGLVFIALTAAAANPTAQAVILAFAFFAGTFLWNMCARSGSGCGCWVMIKARRRRSSISSRCRIGAAGRPLTTLEGMTIWDDTRFYQEGMQNAHALATADMLRLALRTPYSAQKLIDWVDQAILRIHTKTLWQAGLSAITIRRASSLIDSSAIRKRKKRSAEKMEGVVESFNAAQMMSLGVDSPRLKAYDQAAALEKAAAELAVQTARLKEANTALAAGGEAARDNVVKLRGEVDGLAGKTAAAQTAHDAAAKIVDDETGPWAEGAELAQQLRGLTAGSPTLLQNGVEALVQQDQQQEARRAGSGGGGQSVCRQRGGAESGAAALPGWPG